MATKNSKSMHDTITTAVVPANITDPEEKAVALRQVAKTAKRLTEARAVLDVHQLGDEITFDAKREKFEAMLPEIDAEIRKYEEELSVIAEDVRKWTQHKISGAKTSIGTDSKIMAPYNKVTTLFSWQQAAAIIIDIDILHSVSSESDFRDRTGYRMDLSTLTRKDSTDNPQLFYKITPHLMFGDKQVTSFAPIYERVPSTIEKDKAFLSMLRKAQDLTERKAKASKRRDLIAKKASFEYTNTQLEKSNKAAKADLYGKALGVDLNAMAIDRVDELMNKELAEIDKAVNK